MSQIWERLLHYREELVDVCDEVNGVLEKNRDKREEWHSWSESWKEVWAPWLAASEKRHNKTHGTWEK